MEERKFRGGFLDHPAAAETHNQTIHLLNTLERIEQHLDKWLRYVSESQLAPIEQWLARISGLLEQIVKNEGLETGRIDHQDESASVGDPQEQGP